MRRLFQLSQSRLLLLAIVAVAAIFGHPVAALAVVVPVGNTLAALDQALQITYAEPFINQVITDSDWLDLVETDSNVQEDQAGAKYVETSHYMRYGGSVGSRLEDEYLTESLPAQFLNSRIYLKKITFSIDMTGDVMRRMKSGQQSWVDYADRALTDLSEKTRDHMDRMALMYGYAVRAQVSGTPTLVSAGVYDIVLKNWCGVPNAENAWLMFNENDSIVFTGSLTAPIALRTGGAGDFKAVVSDVDETNGASGAIRVVMSAALAATIVDGDYIGEGDNRGNSFPAGNPAVERDFMGLLGHVDDGGIIATYFNVTRSSNRRFRSIIVDGSAAPWAQVLTDRLLNYADTLAQQRVRAMPDLILTSTDGDNAYWADLKQDRMFQDPRQYTGGKPRGLQVMLGDRTLTLRVARKIAPQYTWLLQMNTFRMFSAGPMQWDDTTGSLWNRVVDSTGPKDKFYATGFFYRQLWNYFCRKNVRIENLKKVV
mgnify:CR=1 FL=1